MCYFIRLSALVLMYSFYSIDAVMEQQPMRRRMQDSSALQSPKSGMQIQAMNKGMHEPRAGMERQPMNMGMHDSKAFQSPNSENDMQSMNKGIFDSRILQPPISAITDFRKFPSNFPGDSRCMGPINCETASNTTMPIVHSSSYYLEHNMAPFQVIPYRSYIPSMVPQMYAVPYRSSVPGIISQYPPYSIHSSYQPFPATYAHVEGPLHLHNAVLPSPSYPSYSVVMPAANAWLPYNYFREEGISSEMHPCPANSVFQKCTMAIECRKTCQQPTGRYVCGPSCVSRCECATGYVWQTERCIRIDECGIKEISSSSSAMMVSGQCPQNAVFRQCSKPPECRPSCGNYQINRVTCSKMTQICRQGCDCMEGYVYEKGYCVARQECGRVMGMGMQVPM